MRILTSDTELRGLCERAGAAGRFGLDTEFVRDRTYFARLALVQISVEDQVFIVDPLAVSDLSPLEQLVSDESVCKVLHAAQQDLEIFFQRTGSAPANVFDTQAAGAMVGVGYQVGYAPLVGEVLGKELSKGSQYSDWLRRPLTEKQLAYAADDVRHLLPLMDALIDRLDELERRDACEEELAGLSNEAQYQHTTAQLVARLKGSGNAKGQRRAVLFRLVAWRESEAQHRDVPRRWVVADAPLVALASSAPRSMGELRQVRGLNGKDVARSGQAILRAIELGMKDEVPEGPKRPNRRATSAAAPVVRALLEALCAQAQIALPVVASSATVEALASSHAAGTLDTDGNPLIEGWRGALFGQALLDFLDAKTAVGLDPATGRLVLINPRPC